MSKDLDFYAQFFQPAHSSRPVFTREDVRVALHVVCRERGVEKAKEIMQVVGKAPLPLLHPERFADVFAACAISVFWPPELHA